MNSRNKIRRWVGLATSLTLITVLAAAVPTTAQRAPTDQDLRQAQQFREAFGLGHSMAIVRESFADPDAYPDLSNGIPLSREEAGELDRRQALFLAALPAIDFATTLDGFAESHLDQRRGGIPVFYFTGDSGSPMYRQITISTVPPTPGRVPIGIQAAASFSVPSAQETHDVYFTSVYWALNNSGGWPELEIYRGAQGSP